MLAVLALLFLDCSPASWLYPLTAPRVVAAGKIDVDGRGEAEAYRKLRRELMAQYPDWMRASEKPGFAKALNRAWRMVGNATAEYLRAHPGAGAKQIVAAVEELDGGKCAEKDGPCASYALEAGAIPFGGGAFVVSAAYPQSGTFFVVDSTGVRWNVKDAAAPHYARRDEIGKWAWIGFPWGDGPLIPRLRPLAPARNGHPRFCVDADSGTMAGGTFARQISVWEWTGREAVPQFIRSYLISFDTGAIEVNDEAIRIPTKGDFKTFFSCGQCVEPEVIWTLSMTPDGVHDAGRRHVVAELEKVDELFDRIVRGKSTKDLAAPRVAATLRKLLADVEPGVHQLGMLGEWHVTNEKGRQVLEFLADGIECGPWRFEIETQPAGLYFSDVKTAAACSER